MNLYRSKPSAIYAVQWTGDNLKEIEDFGVKFRYSVERHRPVHLRIKAGKDGAQGYVPVPVGHWIVRRAGSLSNHWPVDPDYFASKCEIFFSADAEARPTSNGKNTVIRIHDAIADALIDYEKSLTSSEYQFRTARDPFLKRADFVLDALGLQDECDEDVGMIAAWRRHAREAEQERDEDVGVIAVWRRRTRKAEQERDLLRNGIVALYREVRKWQTSATDEAPCNEECDKRFVGPRVLSACIELLHNQARLAATNRHEP